MNLRIQSKSGVPIYEQIVVQMRELILKGILKEGEMLPSIRSLASDLKISVITTKRAYEELERDGFICTQAGKGSFVAAQDAELARESNLREIEEHLQAAVELGRQIELPAEELQHILQVLIEEE